MNKNSWILSTKLLFRPTIISKPLLDVINNQIKKGADPLLSIAYSIDQIMEIHTKRNLEPVLGALKIAFNTTYNDLVMLRLGYRYIVSSIIITLLCKDLAVKDRIPHATWLLEYSEDEEMNAVQTSIIKALRATINLYNLDTSGAFVFQFLTDYPPFHSEYFKAGMEMAILLISGLSQIVQALHPSLNWPPPAQDLSIST